MKGPHLSLIFFLPLLRELFLWLARIDCLSWLDVTLRYSLSLSFLFHYLIFNFASCLVWLGVLLLSCNFTIFQMNSCISINISWPITLFVKFYLRLVTKNRCLQRPFCMNFGLPFDVPCAQNVWKPLVYRQPLILYPYRYKMSFILYLGVMMYDEYVSSYWCTDEMYSAIILFCPATTSQNDFIHMGFAILL